MASMLAASSNMACTSIRCASAAPAARTIATPPLRLLPLPAATPLHCPLSVNLGASAMAATLFASLASVNSAMAAQEMMSLAADDNRGLALLLPLIPAVAWVLFNILQPALNQFDRMKSAKGLALGLGAGAASALLMPSQADAAAAEIMKMAAAAESDSRGSLLLLVLLPAVGWVLFNILKPGLSQLEKMRSTKGIAAAAGLTAAAAVMSQASPADAAVQEIGRLADAAGSDSRGLLLFAALVPALGWVLFNILQPALNQLDRMKTSKGIAAAVGLGAAAGLLLPSRSDAVQEISAIADASSDSRGILLLGVLIPAVGWVLFNILQPGLNQLDKMRTQK